MPVTKEQLTLLHTQYRELNTAAKAAHSSYVTLSELTDKKYAEYCNAMEHFNNEVRDEAYDRYVAKKTTKGFTPRTHGPSQVDTCEDQQTTICEDQQPLVSR